MPGSQRERFSLLWSHSWTLQLDPQQGILLLSLLPTTSCSMVMPPTPHCFLLFHLWSNTTASLGSPENLPECQVMLPSATTFPCLVLNSREGLCPDICMGMRAVRERAITTNCKAQPIEGMALCWPQPLCFLYLAISVRKKHRGMGNQTTAFAIPILQMRRPRNGGTKVLPGFKPRSPDSRYSALSIAILCF